MRIKTTDTYKVAFFLMYGGILVEVMTRKIDPRRAMKKGYQYEHTFFVDNVPVWAWDMWEQGMAYANLYEYAQIRRKIKKLMNKRPVSHYTSKSG